MANTVTPGSERAAHELVDWCRVNCLGDEAAATVCRARGASWLGKTGLSAAAMGTAAQGKGTEEDGSIVAPGACGKAAYWLAKAGGGIQLERLCAEVSERLMVDVACPVGPDVIGDTTQVSTLTWRRFSVTLGLFVCFRLADMRSLFVASLLSCACSFTEKPRILCPERVVPNASVLVRPSVLPFKTRGRRVIGHADASVFVSREDEVDKIRGVVPDGDRNEHTPVMLGHRRTLFRSYLSSARTA